MSKANAKADYLAAIENYFETYKSFKQAEDIYRNASKELRVADKEVSEAYRIFKEDE